MAENKFNNLQIEQFKQDLQNLIAQSQLPVGVVTLILYQINNEIDKMYLEQVRKEFQEMKGEEENGC